MKILIFGLVSMVSVANADFASGFVQGMKDGEQSRLRQMQMENLRRENGKNRADDEREYQEWVDEQDHKGPKNITLDMNAHEKGNDLETEKVKNERIKLKLEALKQGYELTDDGELVKIDKKQRITKGK